MIRTIAAFAFVVLALAPAAAAKDGVVARLTAPLATAPSGGVTVEFSLVAEDGSLFSASGIYVRARTKDGSVLEIWPEERGTGHFAGRLPTRRSELADLEIALVGWSSPGGRSDMVFPIADDPFPGPPPAVVRTTPRKEGPRTSAAFAIGGVLLAFGAAAVAVRRIRR